MDSTNASCKFAHYVGNYTITLEARGHHLGHPTKRASITLLKISVSYHDKNKYIHTQTNQPHKNK